MEVAEVRRRELLSESAPSSPREAQEWGSLFFTSAPASPSRAAAIFRSFDGGAAADPSPEEDADDFAFDFNGGASPLTADELFEHGVIRPLKLPPRLQSIPTSPVNSPKSPVNSRFRRSPRRRSPDADPFAAAIAETTRGRDLEPRQERRRAARSLSPLRRLFDFHAKPAPPPKAGGGKWRLKDLLLFRSASEGRATGEKDRVRKYTAISATTAALLSKKGSGAAREEERGSSFRSMEGSARRGGASAHERHYAANRAAAEELRKKTMLPYRQSLFGFLSFNPAITGLTKGFSSIRARHE